MSIEDQDEVLLIDEMCKYLDAFIGYQEYLNRLKIKLDELKKKLLNELKQKGIDL